MTDTEITSEIIKESERIEECCEYSSKAHYNDCAKWRKRHFIFSTPIAICAAVTALIPFVSLKNFLAIVTAILAAVQTILKPQVNQQTHKIAGDSYSELRNKVRRFRTIDLHRLDINDASEQIKIYGDTLDKLNTANPSPSEDSYKKAKQGIAYGETEFRADKEN